MRRALALALWILLAAPRAASALSSGADFLRSEVPARPSSMAGAFGAFADDSTAFLYNPGALAVVRQPALSITHFSSIIDTTYDEASFVQPLKILKTPGGLAISVQYSATANLFETDLGGNDKGSIDNHDLVIKTGYGFMVTRSLGLGLALEGFSSQLAEYKSRGLAVDLGVRSKVTERVDLGLSFQHLGVMEAYDRQADPLPALLRVSGHFLLIESELVRVRAGAELDRPWNTADPIFLNAGLEYWYANLMAFRGGWRFGADTGNLALGVGFKWSGLTLDYAYVSMGDLGPTHRYTLGMELGTLFEKARLFVPELGPEVQAPPPPRRVEADPLWR